MGNQGLPMETRFWMKVDKRGEDDCWYWTGAHTNFGHGQLGKPKNSGLVLAHRYSYELHYGPIPEGKQVNHKCNHPPCVNPKHLEIGTQEDNMSYASKSGRIHGALPLLQGERHHNTQLTNNEVIDIKQMLANGVERHEIAKQFSVSKNVISKIKTGARWVHVTLDDDQST